MAHPLAPSQSKFLDGGSCSKSSRWSPLDHADAPSAFLYLGWPRVRPLTRIQVRDYYEEGGRRWLRLQEKRGQIHKTEVHPELEAILDRYLDAAGIRMDPGGPMFRTVRGRSLELQRLALTENSIRDLIARRGEAVGLQRLKPSMFRPSGYTVFREHGGSREHGQLAFGHEYADTTDIYDRRIEIGKAERERMMRLTLRFDSR